jgi:long-chain fatty acid transport protein
MRFSLGPVLLLALASPAVAGGLTLPVQGVRSLERAGALVAGAEDADALWLDPAGLAHTAGAGHQALLFDVAYVYQPVTYSAGATNQQPGSPAPNLAGALGVSDRLVIAAGFSTPYAGLHRYDVSGPTRYASTNLAGTTFARITVGAAYVVTPELRVGATVQDNVTILDHRLVASACPGTMTCDRNDDMPMQIAETDYIAPSGSLGVQYDAAPAVTLAAMAQSPTRVSSTGTLTLTPPPALAGAMVTGNRVTESFTLPPIVRAGVEWHTPAVRVEAALDVELWSLHDAIAIDPQGVAVGSMPVKAMTIPRHFQTSFAPSLGAEFHTGAAQLGAGIEYETAAAPPSYVSALTVDASKLLVTIGGGYASGGWQIGAAAGYAKLADVTVTDPKVPVLEPLRDASSGTFINAGTYKSYYLVAGLRLARSL